MGLFDKFKKKQSVFIHDDKYDGLFTDFYYASIDG